MLLIPTECAHAYTHAHTHTATHYLVYLLLFANIPMALYFSMVHQRGTVVVMDYIRNVTTSHGISNKLNLNTSIAVGISLKLINQQPQYSTKHQWRRKKGLEPPHNSRLLAELINYTIELELEIAS